MRIFLGYACERKGRRIALRLPPSLPFAVSRYEFRRAMDVGQIDGRRRVVAIDRSRRKGGDDPQGLQLFSSGSDCGFVLQVFQRENRLPVALQAPKVRQCRRDLIWINGVSI